MIYSSDNSHEDYALDKSLGIQVALFKKKKKKDLNRHMLIFHSVPYPSVMVNFVST